MSKLMKLFPDNGWLWAYTLYTNMICKVESMLLQRTHEHTKHTQTHARIKFLINLLRLLCSILFRAEHSSRAGTFGLVYAASLIYSDMTIKFISSFIFRLLSEVLSRLCGFYLPLAVCHRFLILF